MLNELVLVTGASGFAAGWIVKYLLESGWRVRGTVRSLSSPKTDALKALASQNADQLTLVEADLLDPVEKWESVVQGCTYVCHTASPFPLALPKDEQELIKPAVEGTRVVLEASHRCGVKRVVLTSSVASIFSGWTDLENKVFTEEDWAKVDEALPYQKSKALAEKAAWEYVQQLPQEGRMELVTLCPSLILGPLLTETGGDSSKTVLLRLLNNAMPGVPNLWFNVVDVRDVARAHIAALSAPEAAGKRYICSSGGMWMIEIATLLDKEFGPKGYKIPLSKVPNFVIWIVGLWDQDAAGTYPRLDKKQLLSNQRIVEDLKLQFLPVQETISEMANSLIAVGLAKPPH